jgi:tRNA dimethylallyltransferase
MVRAETRRRPVVAADRLSVPPSAAEDAAADRGLPCHPPLLVVAGPTGAGKSALAADVAEAFGGTVINADALQVYRALPVLTARPSAADTARVPHRLYGVLATDERCSAGRWREMALAAIAEARAHRRLPIVCGGTGLYLDALLRGLAPVPPIPEAVRAAAAARLAAVGGDAFRAELARLDPDAAARLPAGDRQRLMRAWEVVTATGRPLADWQRQAPATPGVAGPILTLLLLPPRERLYPALDARFAAMLAAGALAEVRQVMALPPALPLMKAVGVRPLAAHLRGEVTLEAACAAAKQETRRYAKRQSTWFRHRLAADRVITEQLSESLEADLFAFIRRFLLTGCA